MSKELSNQSFFNALGRVVGNGILPLMLAAFASQGANAAAFDPSQVNVSSFSYSGAGCPSGTVAYDVSTDRKAVTILFDDFSVSSDEARPESVGRHTVYRAHKMCRLRLGIKAPKGWQFSLVSLRFMGFASLDREVEAVHLSNYMLDLGRVVNLATGRFKGPFDDDYERVSDIPVRKARWSSCKTRDHSLTIDAALTVKSKKKDAEGSMTIDSLDGEILQSYGVKWRRCPGSEDPTPDNTAGAKTFTKGLYKGFLGRSPDRSGLAHYVKLLKEGKTCRSVAKMLFGSDERKRRFANLSDVDKVKGLYIGLLGRTSFSRSTMKHVRAYADAIANGQKTVSRIFSEMSGSTEFKNRCKKLRLKP